MHIVFFSCYVFTCPTNLYFIDIMVYGMKVDERGVGVGGWVGAWVGREHCIQKANFPTAQLHNFLLPW